MGILTHLAAGFAGFLFGTVITCFLLAKKNLETYQNISQNVGSSVSQNIQVAKAVYNNSIAEYENGGVSDDEDASEEEESEDTLVEPDEGEDE